MLCISPFIKVQAWKTHSRQQSGKATYHATSDKLYSCKTAYWASSLYHQRPCHFDHSWRETWWSRFQLHDWLLDPRLRCIGCPGICRSSSWSWRIWDKERCGTWRWGFRLRFVRLHLTCAFYFGNLGLVLLSIKILSDQGQIFFVDHVRWRNPDNTFPRQKWTVGFVLLNALDVLSFIEQVLAKHESPNLCPCRTVFNRECGNSSILAEVHQLCEVMVMFGIGSDGSC